MVVFGAKLRDFYILEHLTCIFAAKFSVKASVVFLAKMHLAVS
ncbi:hypothetical protein RLO149_c035250 [Roseobacter litoralis Och 149]|uniref:Uncharacterized protein n=1 Tax=Roseobacter litoralis (strain ATCC 49566 / DSM 6996 / JCM 21268 / NBRC 15278 / OCh 149) TaxID=391595 RepID=F7ZAB8_ROSLO|nr:hypothetical protein RLO149_c035250 [Roseobacter litoralis Och 149]